MKKILIFTAGFGEGHNTAARNVRDALEHIAPDEAKVEVLDLFDTCYGKLNDFFRKAYIAAINRTPRVWGKIYNVIDGTQFVESNMMMLAKMKRVMSDVLVAFGARRRGVDLPDLQLRHRCDLCRWTAQEFLADHRDHRFHHREFGVVPVRERLFPGIKRGYREGPAKCGGSRAADPDFRISGHLPFRGDARQSVSDW